jgi:hypothetical protein
MSYFASVILILINIRKIILHKNAHTSIRLIQSLLNFVSYVLYCVCDLQSHYDAECTMFGFFTTLLHVYVTCRF